MARTVIAGIAPLHALEGAALSSARLERSHAPQALVSHELQRATARLAESGIDVGLTWGDEDAARQLRPLGRAFGMALVPFRQIAGAHTLHGFVLPGDSRRVFVNTRSRYALRAVIGAEICAAILRDDPDACDKLLTIAEQHTREGRRVTADTLAAYVGQHFTDARFMLAVRHRHPPLWRSVLTHAQHALRWTLSFFRHRPDLLPHAGDLEDCRRMRTAAAAMLREHVRHEPAPSAKTSPVPCL